MFISKNYSNIMSGSTQISKEIEKPIQKHASEISVEPYLLSTCMKMLEDIEIHD